MTMIQVKYAFALTLCLAGCADLPQENETNTDAPGADAIDVSSPKEVTAFETGWSGCRGAANRVCSELVNPNYTSNHPSCTANTLTCAGWYYACNNDACPPPSISERADALTMLDYDMAGDLITSRSQQFKLVMQSDGNLVVYRTTDNAAIWNSHTNGSGATSVKFQADGNLVIYKYTQVRVTPCNKFYGCYVSQSHAVWSTRTNGSAPTGSYLVMQDDGNLVMYRPNGTVAWSIR